MSIALLQEITGGDPVQMAALAEEFRGHLQRSITALKTAAGEDEWAAMAHRLKGGALAVGATEVAALARQAEEGGIADRDSVLSRIDDAFAKDMLPPTS